MDSSTGLLFKNAHVIDGVDNCPFKQLDVLVRNRYIAKVGRTILPLENDRIIDLQGKTILPGLIDAHVHLCFDGTADAITNITEEVSEQKRITLLKSSKNAQLHLTNGVTTVRDLGGPMGVMSELLQVIHEGKLFGPRILTSGEVITTTGGHCHFIGYEVDDALSARIATRQALKNKAHLIKVMATGGVSTPGSKLDFTQFSQSELMVIVEEAHRQNRKVSAHANGLEGIQYAVKAGVDSIEHGTYVNDEVLGWMKEKRIWYVPTLIPAVILLQTKNDKLSDSRRQGIQERWIIRQKAVKNAIEKKVQLVAGTDAGIGFVPHGIVAREVEEFNLLGLTPMEAIWTATCWAADLLGILDEVGTIEPGKVADLIVVDGNPLKDLRLLQKPILVVKNGRIVRMGYPNDEKDIWWL